MSRHLALVLQNVEAQIFCARVEDEIAFGLENHGIDPETMEGRIQAGLEAASATHLRHRRFDGLSVGERQRALLAAVLALRPPVLVLDEPFAYLDAPSAARLSESIRQLAESGHAIMLIEHRAAWALPLATQHLPLAPQEERHPGTGGRAAIVYPSEARKTEAHRPAIEVSGLRLEAASSCLAPSVNFTLDPGESMLLLGTNGSGKTTLLRTLVGLRRPPRRCISIVGDDPARVPTRRIALRAAMVTQCPSHQLHLPSVREEVLAAAPSAEAAERWMAAFALEHLADRHPHSLSKGQQRCLSIAAALARDPGILLADELTVGLDTATLDRMLQVLIAFTERGGAVLAASHDPRVVEVLGGRCLILDGAARVGGKDLAQEFLARYTPELVEGVS